MSRASEPTPETVDSRSVSLGDVEPAGSRHMGRRSAVSFAGDAVVVGTADGSVVAFDSETLTERWSDDGDGSVVSIVPVAPDRASGPVGRDGHESGCGGGNWNGGMDGLAVAVGERSTPGSVRVIDVETGDRLWTYDTAEDVGEPARDTRFFLPFVVDVVAARADDGGPPTDAGPASRDAGPASRDAGPVSGDAGPESRDAEPPPVLYVAARRYERRDGGRAFQSVVYGFAPDGTERWRYETDASPIGLDLHDGNLAVAYNRCPGDHRDGLVVLDAETGAERWRWDPPASGERRIGDVSLRDGPAGGSPGAVVTSHADYCGYAIGADGDVSWRAELATPVERAGDTVYAYPNHVHATPDGVIFVTGNTYPEEGRETDGRHPLAHTAVGYAAGERRWSASVGGFANAVAGDGSTLAVPSAQAFRERDEATHGLRLFDVGDGHARTVPTRGILTAATQRSDRIAAVEEPVRYHDDGTELGAYRLHVLEP